MEKLKPGVWRWTAPHPDWEADADWDEVVSCYVIDDNKRLVIIDPLDPPTELLDLAADHDPDAISILLTCPWHRRSAIELAAKLKLRIYVPHPDKNDREPVSGSVYAAGDKLSATGSMVYPGLETNDLVHWFPAVGAVVAGDTLIERDGELVIPTDWVDGSKNTLQAVIQGLRPLLDLPVQIVLPTHGEPHPPEALERVLS